MKIDARCRAPSKNYNERPVLCKRMYAKIIRFVLAPEEHHGHNALYV